MEKLTVEDFKALQEAMQVYEGMLNHRMEKMDSFAGIEIGGDTEGLPKQFEKMLKGHVKNHVSRLKEETRVEIETAALLKAKLIMMQREQQAQDNVDAANKIVNPDTN